MKLRRFFFKASPFFGVLAFVLALALLIRVTSQRWLVRYVNDQIQGLRSPDATVRRRAASDLGTVAIGPRGTVALTAALKDSDPVVRANAAESLGNLAVLTTALADASPVVRQRAACDLANLYEGKIRVGAQFSCAVDPLIASIKDATPAVRMYAAEALGYCLDARTIDPLTRGLADEESAVRRAAAQALGRTGSDRAIGSLLAALKRHGAGLREAYYVLASNRQPPEDALIEALDEAGDRDMAQALLDCAHCGSKSRSAVNKWATEHGYKTITVEYRNGERIQ